SGKTEAMGKRKGLAGLPQVPCFLDVSAVFWRGKEAGELGFEPRQADPESAVLPLHHSPRGARRVARRFALAHAQPALLKRLQEILAPPFMRDKSRGSARFSRNCSPPAL